MKKNWKIFLGIVILVLAVVLAFFALSSSRKIADKNGLSFSVNEMARDTASFGVSFGGVSGSAMKIATAPEADSYNQESQNIKERMIIKTGSLSMVVEDVREGVRQIIQYATDNAGFVVHSNIYKSGLSPVGEVSIRIPVALFDSGLGEIKKLGEVKSESVNGQDVTEEYVDLDSQLKNLRAAENQFLQIMSRAVKIEDVLAVQRELTNVRGQIESIQGRMKYLTQSVEMSTLTVYLSTDPSVLPAVDQENKWKPWAEVKAAARSLLEVGKSLANFVIWLVIFIPVWLVVGLVVWVVLRIIKKRKNLNM